MPDLERSGVEPRGPVAYARLMDNAIDGMQREITERLRSDAAAQAESTARWLRDALQRAYLDGLREGYSQAVREYEAGNDG